MKEYGDIQIKQRIEILSLLLYLCDDQDLSRIYVAVSEEQHLSQYVQKNYNKRKELLVKKLLLSLEQRILLAIYLHLFAVLKDINIYHDKRLCDIRNFLGLKEEFSKFVYRKMQMINPKCCFSDEPVISILNPAHGLRMWAESLCYSVIKDGYFIHKERLQSSDFTQYEHPLDRTAREILEGTVGLSTVVSKFNEYAIERLIKNQYIGSKLRVRKREFPMVYRAYETACETLKLDVIPDLYFEQGYINAKTMGVVQPIVVITTGCTSLLTFDELVFIFGHEIGHIKSRHVLYHQMADVFPMLGDIIGAASLGVGKLLISGLQLALLNWKRKSEFTADRAGLLACQNVEAAVSIMMKISGLPINYFGKVSTESFLKQARDFESLDDNAMDVAAKFMSVMLQDHPWMVERAGQLDKWVNQGYYEKILHYNSESILKIKGVSDEIGSKVVTCLVCGIKNKVSLEKNSIGKMVVNCGKCKTKLFY